MIMNSTLGRLPSSGAFGVRRNREEKGEKMDRKTKQTLYRSFHLVHGARAALGGIPLQVVEVLLLVAMEEGITQHEAEDRLNLGKPSVSRAVATLGPESWVKRGEARKRGYGFVQRAQDPQDHRRELLTLTRRGERFVAELLEASIAGRRVRSYEPPKESTA